MLQSLWSIAQYMVIALTYKAQAAGSQQAEETMVLVFFAFLVLCWLYVIAFIMYGRYRVSGTIGSRKQIFTKDSLLNNYSENSFFCCWFLDEFWAVHFIYE